MLEVGGLVGGPVGELAVWRLAVLEVGGLVGELAVGRLAVPLQATLALELWEEGGSLAESWLKCPEVKRTDEGGAAVESGRLQNSEGMACQA